MNFTVILPQDVRKATNVWLLALCTWREASNQSHEAKIGVAWTIRNRVDHPSWYGKDYYSVITKPVQFTSMVPPPNLKDPNLTRYPSPDDPSWAECLIIAFDVIVSNVKDPTGGATFYFDKSMDGNPPSWSKVYHKTADIDSVHFFKP